MSDSYPHQERSELGLSVRMIEDQRLLDSCVVQLRKDLMTDRIPAMTAGEQVIPKLLSAIEMELAALRTNGYGSLVNALYRVDLPEAMATSMTDDQELAKAVLLRCSQKVLLRRKFGGRDGHRHT